MIEDRDAAAGGVPQGARGGLHDLYRSLGQAQVSRRGASVRALRTIRRERQVRGDWKGEPSLRHYAVPRVLRQPAAIKSPENKRNNSEKEIQSCLTQGVGIAVQTLVQKDRAQNRGETMAVRPGRKDRRLAGQASVVQRTPHQPLSLANFQAG
jgi:hypothetical protein